MDPLMTFVKHFIRLCWNTTGIFNYPNLTGFQPWMLDFVIIDLGSEGKENVPQNLFFLTDRFINKV